MFNVSWGMCLVLFVMVRLAGANAFGSNRLQRYAYFSEWQYVDPKKILFVDFSHFGLGIIAARNSRSETLLLFFGIHMANASILAARQLAREEKARAKEIRA